MSNPSDPRFAKDSQGRHQQVDKTYIEQNIPGQGRRPLQPNFRVDATSTGSVNPYTNVPAQTQVGQIGNISMDLLPSGNEPIPLGSGTIVSIIGSGGMARVYKIWNEKLEVFRAVKILIPGQTDLKNRFDTEAKITAKLHHPNIVEIYNVGDWKNLPYLEMEFIDGDSLETFIARYGVLPPAVCSSIAIYVARALAYAHSQEFLIYGKNYHGVIHRDLKPANIMISKSGDVRLMDFGIARPTEASLHTVEGNIVGTMQYLSPEQIDGVDIDGRTDIYSFGAILYEMLTGTKTFPQDTITNLMKNKIMNEYRRCSDFDFNISPALSRISQKCLKIDKGDRYPNVDSLLQELESVHKSITNDPPKKILEKYLNDPESIPSSPKKMSFHISPKIVIPTLGSIIVAGVVMYVLVTNPEKKEFNQSASTVKDSSATISETARNDSTNLTNKPEIVKPDTVVAPPKPVIAEKPRITANKAPSIVKKPKPKPAPKPKPSLVNSPADTTPPLTPLEQLYKKYSLSDPVAIGKKAINSKSYNDAILALESTPKDHPEYKLKTLLLLQAYVETSRTKDALFIANSETLSDAQYDFLCGRLYALLGKYKQSLNLYQEALTKPSIVRNRSDIRNDALYYTAQLWSSLYKQDPNPDTRIQALNAWNIVKRAYFSQPSHQRFKKANQELASIQ